MRIIIAPVSAVVPINIQIKKSVRSSEKQVLYRKCEIFLICLIKIPVLFYHNRLHFIHASSKFSKDKLMLVNTDDMMNP